MIRVHNSITTLFARALRVAIVAIALLALGSCNFVGKRLSYAPWTDLSYHFSLEKVRVRGSKCYFNTYEITEGCRPYTSERIGNNDYYATVLGSKVWVRSERKSTSSTQVCWLNTGDVVSLEGAPSYVNGKYWSYVYVSSGYNQGECGYVCSDYLVKQDKYKVLKDFVLSSGSNITTKYDSKYLNAIADILLKLRVNRQHPRLAVNIVHSKTTSRHTIKAYQIRNLNARENDSLLAFVKFTQGSNDYVVLGIVPGQHVNNIEVEPNGSYDIYFSL